MTSLKARLLAKIKREFYCSRNKLRNKASEAGFDVSTADRKLRELTEEKKIKPDFNKKFIKGYFYNGKVCQNTLTGIEFEKMKYQNIKKESTDTTPQKSQDTLKF